MQNAECRIENEEHSPFSILRSAFCILHATIMKILTAEQMKNVDRRATDRFGIPSILMMENAAIAVVDAIFEHYPSCERASIFCGIGSNGGDGLAVARHLENRGVVPSLFIIGDRSKFAGDAARNFTICERLALPMYQVTTVDSLNGALVHAAPRRRPGRGSRPSPVVPLQ